MSPLYEELSRLARRYDDACRSPLSCPRDREILRTKLRDLEEAVNILRVKAAKAIEINEAEVERLRHNLDQMRQNRGELALTRKNSKDSVIDQATLLDAEALVAYTRFIIGILENRESERNSIEDADPDHSSI